MAKIFFQNYLRELNKVCESISVNEFEDFVKALIDTYEIKANVFVCGNGGSASTASHFACDINKGVSFGKNRKFRVICLNDNIPTMLAYANDLSYEDVFVEQLKNFLTKDDLVIGISASGNSNNVLKALEYANKFNAKSFGICGFDGGRLKNIARQSIVIKSNDMQKIEDLHMVIVHVTMQYLNALHVKPENIKY